MGRPEKSDIFRANEAKLASLYEEYYDRIARYAYSRINNRAEAEDIASETFVKALKSLGGYTERGVPMQAWLFRIAHNLIVDRFRQLNQKEVVPVDDVQIESPEDPEKVLEIKAEMEGVNRAMQQLTPEQGEVIRLRFFGELSAKEVGNIMKKNDGAVREMQRAAIEKLRRVLGANPQLDNDG